MTTQPLALLVALPAEAKPLTRHFGLRRDNRCDDWPLYRDGATALLRCGVGAEAAFAACDWLAPRMPAGTLWINFGVAGHPRCTVGELLIASSIEQPARGEQWTTLPPDPSPCPQSPLFTLDAPDPLYRHPGLCDMEAAGFYAALRAHGVPRHRLHALKVVSDNPQHPPQGLRARQVTALIEARLETFDQALRALGAA